MKSELREYGQISKRADKEEQKSVRDCIRQQNKINGNNKERSISGDGMLLILGCRAYATPEKNKVSEQMF